MGKDILLFALIALGILAALLYAIFITKDIDSIIGLSMLFCVFVIFPLAISARIDSDDDL